MAGKKGAEGQEASENGGKVVIKSDLSQAKEKGKILFIKNLNFNSEEKDIEKLFEAKNIKGLVSIKIIRSNGDSKGYGFAEFKTEEQSEKVIKELQHVLLDDHCLQFSLSKPKKAKQSNKRKYRDHDIAKSNKIIYRNVPFEATRKDIRSIFKKFGEIKSVRLPKKMNNQHRGFAFVEFTSI